MMVVTPSVTAVTIAGAPMRLLHTSDWHLGRTLHGENLLAYQAAFLDWLLAQAVSHEVHAVVVAGDVYDRAVPPLDAVAVLDRALRGFAAVRIPVLITSGNHDSAVRLGFGSRLSELAGVHLRTSVADIARPVIVADEHGDVAIYGVPYLLPDAVMADLGAERSHTSVLAAATALIRADAEERGVGRTVVAAHAFVTGAMPSDSERDIRVGGIGDVPASVFAGLSYVALGHLHGQQDVSSGAAGTTVRYSGSPLAFSFSERQQAKSVTLAEIDGAGQVTTARLATPVPRPLREVRGKLEDLLARSDAAAADLAGAWIKVVLTDPVRPASPMERLRRKWPHTLVLDFDPEGARAGLVTDLRRLARSADPVEICGLFVEYTSGGPADEDQQAVLRDVIEAVQHRDPTERPGEFELAGAGPAGPAGRGELAGLADQAARPDRSGLDQAGSVDEWLANAGRSDDWLTQAELELAFPDPASQPTGTKPAGSKPAAA
jgi:DNA repair protein SbcD/Mre11